MEIHFANLDEPAKCQHVRARSRNQLRKFLQVVRYRGEQVDYDRDRLLERFKDYSGASSSAAEETNTLIKKMGFLDRQNNPTESGRFAGEVIDANRNDLLDEILIQHLRGVPTLAYTLDILRSASQPLTVDDIHERMLPISDARSTSKENSVQNALNLINEFEILTKDDAGETTRWSTNVREQTVIEAVPYGMYLLGRSEATLDAPVLRERLPKLIHCTEEGTERLIAIVRKRYSLFSYGTTGDRIRMDPFGGVFDVLTNNIEPDDLTKSLL